MKITRSKTNCFELDGNDRNKVYRVNCSIEYHFSFEKFPEMNVDALIMERILNLSVYPMNQPVTIKDHDHAYSNKRDLSSIKYTNLSLDRLWHYTCHLTRNRNVSCLCWNEQNHVKCHS